VDEENFALDTRILLAAADFSRELTTTVLWLRERGIDIRCVCLKPYRLEDGRLFVDIQPLIPLPEAEDFQTKLGDKRLTKRNEKAAQGELPIHFLQALLERAQGRSVPHAGLTPSAMGVGVLFGSIGRAGFSINYVIRKNGSVSIRATDTATSNFVDIVGLHLAVSRAPDGPVGYEHALRTPKELKGEKENGIAEFQDDFRRMAARGSVSTVLALAENLPKIMDKSSVTANRDVE
jgi:hypothetical protein